MLLGLLNIASTTAFNAILSLATVGMYVSYIMPILLLLYRRVMTHDLIQFGPWQLGRWGVPINIAAVVYTMFVSIFLLLPPYQPVTALNMNYASVLIGGISATSFAWWHIRGKDEYACSVVTWVTVHADEM